MAREKHELTSDERLIVQELEQLADTGAGEIIAKSGGSLINSSASFGDVDGPASSTDNGVPRFDGTGGKTLQTSGVTIDDTGKITAGANGASGLDVVTYQQLQDTVAGLSPKDSVRVATTANGTFSTAFQNGATVDGITLVTGNRILIKDQTSQDQNGIYIVEASGAPTRASDANTWDELVSAFVFIEAGSTQADTGWVCTINTGGTLGVDNVAFTQFTSSGSGISSLNGLSATSQTFAVGTSGTDFAISSTTSTHTFNLPDAGASARGLVTTGAQTIAGAKTFSSAPILSSLTASKPLLLDASKNVTSGDVTLTSQVTGVLPIANGGTNSSTVLNNNRVIVSSSDAIVEASAITASRALASDANGIPVATATTATELGYVSGVTSAIQSQLDGKADDGDVTSSGLTMNTARLLGRTTASTGAIEELSKASALTFLNVEDGADVTDATNVDAAGATMNTDTDVSSNSWVLDEDTMSSDSNTKVPTQQSVKAYVDTQVASAGGAPYFFPSYQASEVGYSDDYGRWGARSSNQLYLTWVPGVNTISRYNSSMTIGHTTIWASATSMDGAPMVHDGYIYTHIYGSGGSRVYRADVTANISDAGAWTQMTISGVTLGNYGGPMGYDGTYIWWCDESNSRFSKFTLSGTTLTHVSNVTVTGANYSGTRNKVNTLGLFVYFASGARFRFASHAGTLDGEKEITASAYSTPATTDAFYGPTLDSGGALTGFYRVLNFEA